MLRSAAGGRLGIRSYFLCNPCSLFLLSAASFVVASSSGRLSTAQAFVVTPSKSTTAAAASRRRLYHSSSRSTSLLPPVNHHHHSITSAIVMSAAATAASTSTPNPPAVEHVPNDEQLLPSWMLPERTRVLTTSNGSTSTNTQKNCVVYWMQRDVRTVDNWALLYAAHLAKEQNVPLRVLYCFIPPTNHAKEEDDDDSAAAAMTMLPFHQQPLTERYGSFLLGGLELVHAELAAMNVPLTVVLPNNLEPTTNVGATVMDHMMTTAAWQPSHIICDHSPLKPYRTWLDQLVVAAAGGLSDDTDADADTAIIHVDAHNVVPVWHAAPCRQIGARTLRPKIHKLLDKFLTTNDFPTFLGNDHLTTKAKQQVVLPDFEKEQYETYLNLDASVKPVVDQAKQAKHQPGTKAAMRQFDSFTKTGLKQFHELRNNPNYGSQICSNLSPWINHGHISFQRLAYQMKTQFHKKYANGTAMYVEEGLIRRELSDNFVYYTPDTYDTLDAALVWAQDTLQLHAADTREWCFSSKELEEAKSHDDLWNAAQLQLVQEGKMHGFLRMYWAKKILEWTESPEVALKTAQYFNDRYALDGCDPNGFVGVGWSIMAIHDQGWKERDVFGKIRYMNYAGCKRKFDVQQFVKNYPPAATNAAAAAKKHGGEPEMGKRAKPAVAAAKKPAAKKSTTATTKKKAGTKRKSPP